MLVVGTKCLVAISIQNECVRKFVQFVSANYITHAEDFFWRILFFDLFALKYLQTYLKGSSMGLNNPESLWLDLQRVSCCLELDYMFPIIWSLSITLLFVPPLTLLQYSCIKGSLFYALFSLHIRR